MLSFCHLFLCFVLCFGWPPWPTVESAINQGLVQFSSVAYLCLTLCDHMDCSTPDYPRACSNSYLSSQWYHPTILSSVIPFSSCLQSFRASGSFPMSQFFTSGGQGIEISASTSVLPMSIQDWFPLRLTGLISLQSQESSPTPQFKSINSSAFFIENILKL